MDKANAEQNELYKERMLKLKKFSTILILIVTLITSEVSANELKKCNWIMEKSYHA